MNTITDLDKIPIDMPVTTEEEAVAAVEELVRRGELRSVAMRRVSFLRGEREYERHPHPETLPYGEGL